MAAEIKVSLSIGDHHREWEVEAKDTAGPGAGVATSTPVGGPPTGFAPIQRGLGVVTQPQRRPLSDRRQRARDRRGRRGIPASTAEALASDYGSEKKDITPVGMAAMMRTRSLKVRAWERAMSNLLKAHFNRQSRVVVEKLGSKKVRDGFQTKDAIPHSLADAQWDKKPKPKLPPVDKVFDKTMWADQLAADAAGLLMSIYEDFGADEATLLGGEFSVDFPPTAKFLSGQIDRLKLIEDTTANDLQEALEEGMAEDGLGDYLDAVKKVFNDAITGRIPMIAETETHAAANAAVTGAGMQNGAATQTWNTAGDDRVREAHADAEGQTVDIGQPFTVDGEELLFPGDPSGSPGNTISCRCYVTNSYQPAEKAFRVRVKRGHLHVVRNQVEVKADGPVAAGVILKAADTGRVLMLQRSVNEDDPAAGKWEFPGGCLEPGEAPIEGAKREFGEEVGSPLPANASYFGEWTSDNGVYRGHLFVTPSESDIEINMPGSTRLLHNADGDCFETAGFWDPADLPDMPALRDEVRTTPWHLVDEADLPKRNWKVASPRRRSQTKGDVEGHEFHGNQWTGGFGGDGDSVHPMDLDPGDTIRARFNGDDVLARVNSVTSRGVSLTGTVGNRTVSGLRVEPEYLSNVQRVLAAHPDTDKPAVNPVSILKDAKSLKTFADSTFGGHFGGLDTSVKSVTTDGNYGIVKGTITAPNGDKVGSFTRVLSSGGNVDHTDLEIDSRHQGSGFAREFLAHTEQAYREAGFKSISVHADISVGGAAWARLGFGFDHQDHSDRAAAGNLPDRLHQLAGFEMAGSEHDNLHFGFGDSDPIPGTKIDADLQEEANGLARRAEEGSATPQEIYALGADEDHTWTSDKGVTMWPGKALMLGSDWYGRKIL